VHLIYRTRHDETNAKDYEFSRRSMETHWASGQTDMALTLNDPRRRTRRRSGLHVLDLVPPGPPDAAVAPHERRRPEMLGSRTMA
jgi:NTE family protein